jgi:hypothetical protein
LDNVKFNWKRIVVFYGGQVTRFKFSVLTFVFSFKFNNVFYNRPTLAHFQLDAANLWLPPHVMSTILHDLSGGNKIIPCNTAGNMSFKMDEIIMELNPEDYIEKVEDSVTLCYIKVNTGQRKSQFIYTN